MKLARSSSKSSTKRAIEDDGAAPGPTAFLNIETPIAAELGFQSLAFWALGCGRDGLESTDARLSGLGFRVYRTKAQAFGWRVEPTSVKVVAFGRPSF